MKTHFKETFILVTAAGMIIAASLYANPAMADLIVNVTVAGIKSRDGVPSVRGEDHVA